MLSNFAVCEEEIAEADKAIQIETSIQSEVMSQPLEEDGITINFNEVPIKEFIRFVSQIAKVNFIYNEEDLNFNITFVSSKGAKPQNVVEALLSLLQKHKISSLQKNDYYLLEKMSEIEYSSFKNPTKEEVIFELPSLENIKIPTEESEYYTYKLQFNPGSEILTAIKQVAVNTGDIDFTNSMKSMQWIEGTNSLLFSGKNSTVEKINSLIKNLDIPLKQVFIEVLVLETDVKNGMEFGLEWAAGGNYQNRFGFGGGNFAPGSKGFANSFKGINASNTPTGPSQIPLGKGFDLGIIGDIIFHKGRSFLSLGSLVSALQVDGNSTIVLNQKIIAQDNKLSTIFVGDNIPFTGSVVETIGSSQQTTANVEYRDVGVSLNIKPLLGDNDMITLDISEEISEATNQMLQGVNQAGGIQTTKTNMVTRVHVPNDKFLVLSGMIRNTKTHKKSGIPCLGGLPIIGSAFSKTVLDDQKRNIIIFVRPKIIETEAQYDTVTIDQEMKYLEETPCKEDFERGLELVKTTPEVSAL